MLIVEHAVAVAFEVFVLYLVAEFFAHALRVLGMFKATRTVTAVFRHNFFKSVYYFFVRVKRNFHVFALLLFLLLYHRIRILSTSRRCLLSGANFFLRKSGRKIFFRNFHPRKSRDNRLIGRLLCNLVYFCSLLFRGFQSFYHVDFFVLSRH